MKNNNFVIDACFLVRSILKEKNYQPVADFLKLKELHSLNFIIPFVFLHESINSTIRGIRMRGIEEDSQIEEILEFINDCIIDSPVRTEKIIDLMKKHIISFYDANYLEMALKSKAVLCTTDKDLLKAAKAEGVTVWEPGFKL